MAAGPGIVDKVRVQYKDKVKLLHGDFFNNHGMSYHPSFYAKHILTGMWGKEAYDHIEECKKLEKYNKNTNEYIKQLYINGVKNYAYMENVTVDNFDFYKDYTNGEYLKRHPIWKTLR